MTTEQSPTSTFEEGWLRKRPAFFHGAAMARAVIIVVAFVSALFL
jgi:hypothetical protein